MPEITGSNSACLSHSFASPVMTTHVSRLASAIVSSVSPSSFDKAFVVGPGHPPIPAKLVTKITSGQFVGLADLLSSNLRTVEHEPQTFLDGKLLVSKKHRAVEIQDILTWTEAFTIFQMVMCSTHAHRWPDLTKYKLLIIQTARQSAGRAWLEYDLAFCKDAAATGASDWSWMNLDLYNFHLGSPAPVTTQQSPNSSSTTVAAGRGYSSRLLSLPPPPPLLHSWNNGHCRWPFGECHYCHVCNSCDGDHPKVSCPFHSSGVFCSRSPSPAKGGGTEVGTSPTSSLVNSVSNVVPVCPDQQHGLPCSAALFCSSSVSTPSISVPVRSFSPLAPVHLVSPLHLSQFQAELHDYPDQVAAAYVLDGLYQGFHIGFEVLSVSLQSASSNMRSALDHPSFIDDYLVTEVLCGRVPGPFTNSPFPDLHISRFGVIPKSNQPGKWRLILGLSSPEGHNVNDGIPKPPFSVQYVTVDSFIEGIKALAEELLWPSLMW